jgi:ssDNA-binding Zn-finger/Zn-ribbon topoisomerase 1
MLNSYQITVNLSMAIICPKCGAQYDVTLFAFGRTVVCECGQVVDATQPHRKPLTKNHPKTSPLMAMKKNPRQDEK